MTLIDGAGVEKVGFVGDRIDVATYVGEDKVWPKDTNLSVYAPSGGQSSIEVGAYSELKRSVYTVTRTGANMLVKLDVDRARTTQISTDQGSSAGNVGIAITSDGTKGFLSAFSTTTGGVFTLDLDTCKAVKISPASTGAYAVAISPLDDRLYAAQVTGAVKNVQAYDVSTGAPVGAAVTTVNQAKRLAVSPDGSKVYAASKDGKCVYVIDTATEKVSQTVTDTARGVGTGVAAGEGKVFYTCALDTVYQVDGATGSVLNTFTDASAVFTDLAVVAATKRLYATAGKMFFVFDISNAAPTKIAVIDARSTSHVGPLNFYDDGNWAISTAIATPCFEILYLGPPPDSTAVTAIAPEPWQPATDWVNDEPLPEQQNSEPDQIVDER